RFPHLNFYNGPVGKNAVVICTVQNLQPAKLYFMNRHFFNSHATVAFVPFIIIRHEVLG
ncbi:MAG: hypothetical protein ACI9Q9_000110, partial [Flavobacterium sp.]